MIVTTTVSYVLYLENVVPKKTTTTPVNISLALICKVIN